MHINSHVHTALIYIRESEIYIYIYKYMHAGFFYFLLFFLGALFFFSLFVGKRQIRGKQRKIFHIYILSSERRDTTENDGKNEIV